MTPDALLQDKYARTDRTLYAIRDLRRVAGNHSRFLFDFAPDAIVLRWTPDPAPRIMCAFDQDDHGRLSLKKLLRRVSGGDVKADELYVGIAFDGIPEVDSLKAAGCHVFDGVKAAVAAVLSEIKTSVK
jgi:CRISPR-associated protein Cst2